MAGSRKKSTRGGKSPKHKHDKHPKKVKAKREASEIDFETLVREEYTKLHRQYRLMENNRHAIAGASGRLGRQGRLLSQLRDEKDSIAIDLNNATCTAYRQRDKFSIKTILSALENYETYRLDLAHCIADMKEMEENVDKITKRLVDQRLKVQFIFGQALTITQIDHRKKILENRLYHTTTQFDTFVSNNQYVKDEINMMLKFRGQVFRRLMLVKKLSTRIKSKMGGVVYEASQAYEQRDDWVNKTMALRDKNEKDSRQHVLEIKEFQRVLHHDSKIHDFMKLKNVLRGLLENNQQRALRKNTVKIEELNLLLAAYKKTFKVILKMTIYRDVESLVVHYLEEEQKNYSIFKYVTDLNNEVNWLKESIEVIKVQIEELNERSQEVDLKNELELQDLEEVLNVEKMEFQEIASKWKNADASMESFGIILDQAFCAANCTSSAISSMLGNSLGMRPSNICMCMSILERKITELLSQKGELEVRRSVEIDRAPLPKRLQLWQPGVKPKPVGGPFKPKVLITGRLDTEQDDDEAETRKQDSPCYHDELKRSLMEQVKEKKISLQGPEEPLGISPSTMEFSTFPSGSSVNVSTSHFTAAQHPPAGHSPHPSTHSAHTPESTIQPTPQDKHEPAPGEVPGPAPVEVPAPAPVEAPAPTPVEVPAPAPVEVPAPAPINTEIQGANDSTITDSDPPPPPENDT